MSIPYNFRESTRFSSQASQTFSSENPYRRELGTKMTPSLQNCDDQQLCVAHKLALRIIDSFFRFSINYYLKCHTWRGRTEFIGAHSHRDGHEGSHAAITNNLCSNKIEIVRSNLLQTGRATPKTARYLKNTLQLTSPEKEILMQKMPKKTIDAFFDRLSVYQLRHPFSNTHLEKVLNATVDDPGSWNRIDASLEDPLKKLEDQLADECTQKIKTPTEAAEILIQKHLELIPMRSKNIELRKAQLQEFSEKNQEAETLLSKLKTLLPEETSEEEYHQLIKTIKKLLELRAALVKKNLKGASSFEKIVREVRNDYYWLAQLVKNYDQLLSSVNLDSARYRQVELNEEEHSRKGKGAEKDSVSKTVATPNSQKSIGRTMKDTPLSQAINFFHATKKNLQTGDISTDFTTALNELEERNYYLKLQNAELQELNCPEVIQSLETTCFGVCASNKKRRAPTEEETVDQLIDMTKKTEEPLSGNKRVKLRHKPTRLDFD